MDSIHIILKFLIRQRKFSYLDLKYFDFYILCFNNNSWNMNSESNQKVSHLESLGQRFPNSVKRWGEWKILLGRIFLSGDGNLRRSDHSNFFQSQKQHSVIIDHQIKFKISMTCEYKDYEVKIKMVQKK